MKAEDLKKYLPQYLSAESEKELFSEIDSFLKGEQTNTYYASSFARAETLYQGDCVAEMPYVSANNLVPKQSKVIILSNTCDISTDNKRVFPAQVNYAPIVELEKYAKILKDRNIEKERIDSQIMSIRRQRLTNLYYLPAGKKLKKESVAFLDKICHVPANVITANKIHNSRLCTFSNFGFYLFLLKISVHFTRIREGVDRHDF